MAKEAPPRENARFVLPAEPDARWAVVARIWNSALLRRSAKLRDLLVYLCHRWWVEGVTELHEHEIGVDVFQRPLHYDSAQDTLVRVQASQLRKRLERYFADEGRDEPLVLEIAKGTYAPVLRERAVAISQLPPIDKDPHLPESLLPVSLPPPPARSQTLLLLLSALCLLLSSLAVLLSTRNLTQPSI